tara:strand:+ start:1321 stop:1884 length:564 start_codon:yes stop_codon:yes gene_type:complete
MVKKKACVFISGKGTNLNSLIHNSRDTNFPIKIDLVLSNKKDALGINFAKKFSIPFKIFDVDIKEFEKKAIKELKDRKISIICLAGFMKILSKSFLRMFRGKVINIHPSLLPKYKGLHTFKRAIKNKDFFCGCTIHYVDEKMDNGRIILKKRVNINEDDEVKTLQKKVQSLEYKAYSMAIRKIYIKN